MLIPICVIYLPQEAFSQSLYHKELITIMKTEIDNLITPKYESKLAIIIKRIKYLFGHCVLTTLYFFSTSVLLSITGGTSLMGTYPNSTSIHLP
jgi:hypothetical protein